MASKKPVVLVTGASSGFGLEAGRALADNNWQVFGTSRRELEDKSENFRMLTLDVRDDGSVRDCVERVLSEMGKIDLLVNNAGYVINGFAEEVSIEQAQGIFETNFFGMFRMAKAVLPVMRRQNRGRIINISSVLGFLGVPYRSFYTASKFALEGFSESLSFELARFNIQVVLVEPGFFRTGLDDSMQKAEDRIDDYDRWRPKLDKHFGKYRRNGNATQRAGYGLCCDCFSTSIWLYLFTLSL